MNNSDTWNGIYEQTDFGNKYPLSYLVSLFHARVKPEILKTKQLEDANVLDFACSIGANSRVYRDLGMNIYGIDVSMNAISKAVQWGGIGDKSYFRAANLIDKGMCLSDLFPNIEFDFIIASECIYYFKNNERRIVLEKLRRGLSANGLFYANMPTYETAMYMNYKDRQKDEDGMVKVDKTGSVSSNLMVNLPRNKNEMAEMFGLFHIIDIMTTDERIYSEIPMVEYHILARK